MNAFLSNSIGCYWNLIEIVRFNLVIHCVYSYQFIRVTVEGVKINCCDICSVIFATQLKIEGVDIDVWFLIIAVLTLMEILLNSGKTRRIMI